MRIQSITDEAGNQRNMNLSQVVEVQYFKEAGWEDKKRADKEAFDIARNMSDGSVLSTVYDRIYRKLICEDYPQVEKTRLVFSNGYEIVCTGTLYITSKEELQEVKF